MHYRYYVDLHDINGFKTIMDILKVNDIIDKDIFYDDSSIMEFTMTLNHMYNDKLYFTFEEDDYVLTFDTKWYYDKVQNEKNFFW